MSGYEKQGGWTSEYAQPPQQQQQQYGGYQQPPPAQGQYAQQPPYSPVPPAYGSPQQQYGGQPPPPAQGQYGAPPPGQYGGAPPQGQYGQPPPPQQYGQPPPPGQYGQPSPPQQWGAPPAGYSSPPPPQQQYGGAPPQGQYPPEKQGQYGAAPSQYGGGAPPQGQYGGAQQSQQPQRHSVTFRFSTPKTAILNSAVHDPYGKTPFSVHSPDKKHTIVSASNGSVIARIDWDHSSPVIEYGGKKIKAKEWIPFHKESQSRKLTFEGKVYNWTTRETTNYLEPSDRPGYSYVVWHDSTDDVILDVYQDALVIPGLLEAAILGVVLMQSGHPIGDVGGGKSSGTPYFGMALGAALGPVLAGAFH